MMPKPIEDIVLLNLGTPAATSRWAVARYLHEFLGDPRVIDAPRLIRWLLLYGVFVPFRSKSSAHAYRQIWQKKGSPLLLHSQALQQSLSDKLAKHYRVHLAMRYGQPSIQQLTQSLGALKCRQLTIVPLFPQYASAATGSALEKILTELSKLNNIPNINVVNDFYNHPLFIEAYASVINETLTKESFDMLLMSYHGLPERHIDKSGCPTHLCDRQQSCPKITINADNTFCYRAQCFTTSRLLAKSLGLTKKQYQVSFQSRLGKLPWIKPYSDKVLPQLFEQGVRDLVVACPSFTCDCLETLEEIGIRAKQQWRQLGGKNFKLIPCVNNHPKWVKALSQIVTA